jgi:hypothetical protein
LAFCLSISVHKNRSVDARTADGVTTHVVARFVPLNQAGERAAGPPSGGGRLQRQERNARDCLLFSQGHRWIEARSPGGWHVARRDPDRNPDQSDNHMHG